MNNTKQYYKVVEEYPDGYYSTYAFHKFRTKYNINEWAEAAIGGLLVFDDLNSAKTFASTATSFTRCFKCEVEQPVNLPAYRSDAGIWRLDFIAKFWDLNTSYDELHWDSVYSINVDIDHWPNHTAAFKRVKLTEQIYL